jgi:hypothetical protein
MRSTHPPAVERLVRIENLLLNNAVLSSHWHNVAIAVRQRFWLLQDAMMDNGYYVSPLDDIIGAGLAEEQLLQPQSIKESVRTIVSALVFGNYDDVVSTLGSMIADAEGWKKGDRAAVIYARVQAVNTALTEELGRRGPAANSVLSDIRTATARHRLLHESSQPGDRFDDCVLLAEP